MELLILGPRDVVPMFFVFLLSLALKVDRSTIREATGSASEPAWGSLVILIGSEEIGGALALMWEAVGVTISTVRAIGRAFGTSAAKI